MLSTYFLPQFVRSLSHIHAVTVVLGATFALACGSESTHADDWQQFRGPNCSGISTGNKPLPIKFLGSPGTELEFAL